MNKEVIKNSSLASEFSSKYLAYALSTITHRALPDVRDGLKPVQRRLLYAMYLLNLGSKDSSKKSARVVGDVIGKFHPHGDQSVYDALVRLAQEFSLRYPLIIGQGNFGNIDGDNAAAMRYTEAKLSTISELLLENIDEDTVDFKSTYDGELQEPLVFPACFPNLLANGSSGIAVGMATSIPPHNILEICQALKVLNNNKNTTVKDLIKIIPGPDFPTGGCLNVNKKEILKAYSTGKGSFDLRAKYKIEKLAKGQYQICIYEIPFQVNKSLLIEKIADLIISKKNKLLDNIVDESDQNIRIVIHPKNRNVKPEILMESLFQQTDLHTTVSINMNVLNKKLEPKVMSLKEVLEEFLSHRYEVLIRKSQFRLENIKLRLEILLGFIKVYENLNYIIKIIRNNDDPKTILIKKFNFSLVQVNAVLDMRLRSLRKLDEKDIKIEFVKLTKEKKFLSKLISSKKIQTIEINKEIDFISQNFKNVSLGNRKTQLDTFGQFDEDIIKSEIKTNDPLTITLFSSGVIKAQKSFLKNIDEILDKDKTIQNILHIKSKDYLIFVSNFGKFYSLESDIIISGSSGRPVSSYLTLSDGEKILDIFKYEESSKLFVYTNKGFGFLVDQKNILSNKKSGKKIANVKDDVVRGVEKVSPDHDLTLVAFESLNKLKINFFPLDQVPTLDKGKGVILCRGKDIFLKYLTCISKDKKFSSLSGKTYFDKDYINSNLGQRGQSGTILKSKTDFLQHRNFENNYRTY
jgi:topoisomerase-4 subunit A